MAFTGEFSRYIFSFIVCTIYLRFISGAQINKDIQISKWDYEDDYDDFWRKYWTTTKEPDFWWKRLTVEPYVERDTYSSNNHAARIIMLIVGLLVLVLVFICYVSCLKYVNQNTDSTVYSPAGNRLNMPQPTMNRVSSPGNSRTQINTSLAPTGNSSNGNNATDKPPGYDVVVLSDLTARVSNFPEVKPSTPESPPPKYDENFVLKY